MNRITIAPESVLYIRPKGSSDLAQCECTLQHREFRHQHSPLLHIIIRIDEEKTLDVYEEKVNPRLQQLPNGCLRWTGSWNNESAYFWNNGRVQVRRFLYEREFGSIAHRGRVHHDPTKCQYKYCMNPYHQKLDDDSDRMYRRLRRKFNHMICREGASPKDEAIRREGRKRLREEYHDYLQKQPKQGIPIARLLKRYSRVIPDHKAGT